MPYHSEGNQSSNSKRGAVLTVNQEKKIEKGKEGKREKELKSASWLTLYTAEELRQKDYHECKSNLNYSVRSRPT